METKTKELADQILLAIEKSNDVKLIDSLDKEARVLEQSETKASFGLSRYVDFPLQGRQNRRGPGGVKPHSMIAYTVTIEASTHPAFTDPEDEDGFLFKGTWITDPTLDETLREPVNPWEYYGDAYVAFRMKKGMITPAKK
jgi:hypothetical protein